MRPIPSQKLELFPKDAHPYGLTYEEWTIKWWTWLLEIPTKNSPAYDWTGTNAYINQSDPHVFFLCQTYDKNGIVPFRSVMIQEGKSLFFPLINWISIAPEDGNTEDDLLLKAKNKMNTIGNLILDINGQQITNGLEQYRVQSHPFHVNLPSDNILKTDQGIRKVVSDGYWILTKRLTSPVQLRTFGSCTAGTMNLGVKYDITILTGKKSGKLASKLIES